MSDGLTDQQRQEVEAGRAGSEGKTRFFAITAGKHKTVMENTVKLFASSLRERWRLDAVVIPSFSPAVIRQIVCAAFGGQPASEDPQASRP